MSTIHGPSLEAQPQDAEEPVQDPELWMEDGNVIIAAVDDISERKTTHIFKCHKSVLAQQSEVFLSMFSIPPSLNAKDLYDGLPFVRVTDSYKDVKRLLQLLYNSGDMPYFKDHSARSVLRVLSAIEGPLRLAAKYEFTKLRERLAYILKTHWPTKWKAWATTWKARNRTHEESFRIFGAAPGTLRAVNLCYEARVWDALPAALYSLYAIVAVYSPAFLNMKDGDQPPPDSMVALLAGLEPSLVAGFMLARERLRSAVQRIHSLPLLGRYAGECWRYGEQRRCSFVDEWWNRLDVYSNADSDIWYSDPLIWHKDPLTALSYLEAHIDYLGLCFNCTEVIAHQVDKHRRYIWDSLPYIFSLKEQEEEYDDRDEMDDDMDEDEDEDEDEEDEDEEDEDEDEEDEDEDEEDEDEEDEDEDEEDDEGGA
ncbi:hypothetical protein BDW22DRAFT_1353373 [Trametopsis cervina]|nr:hypothetical protein BDW22DRAFT_1353373 [Trametopsis cervina]